MSSRLVLVLVVTAACAVVGGGAAVVATRGEQGPASAVEDQPAQNAETSRSRNTPPPPAVSTDPDVGPTSSMQVLDVTHLEDEILTEMNARRAAGDAKALRASPCARSYAETFSSQYLSEGWLDRRTDGTLRSPLQHKNVTPARSACAGGYSEGGEVRSTAAENVWRGIGPNHTAKDVVAAWMDSPGHRTNMLNPNHAQVGVYCYGDIKDGFRRLMCSAVFTS